MAKKNVRKRRFWICFGIYVGLLLIGSMLLLLKVWNIMIEYEDAQPDHTIKAVMQQLESGDITNIASLEGTKFEQASDYNNIIVERFKDKNLTYKTSKSGATEMGYVVYAGDEKVGNVKLLGSNERTIMGILKIYDWKLESVTTPEVKGDKKINVSVPSGYKVYVNDVLLGDDEQVGEPKQFENMEHVAEYVTPPAIIDYSVTGLLKNPIVKVTDANDNEIDISDAEDPMNIKVTYPQSEITDAIKDYTILCAQTYSNFLSRDLPNCQYTIAGLKPYFPENSYYLELAEAYRKGDMWTISAHNQPPKYTDVVVSEYTQYGDDCYSTRISFTKSIYLHRMGVTRVEKTDQTIVFVKINDKWLIADMITNVAE